MSWDLQVAARTLAQEVRGEPQAGQDAVAHVLKNRMTLGRWGHNLASVCLWRGQFSGWYVPSDPNFAYACGLKDDDPMLVHMTNVMQAALNSTDDPTFGACWYANLSVVNPPWAASATITATIGHHTFYTGVQ